MSNRRDEGLKAVGNTQHSSDMVERVARAICSVAFDGFDPDELVSHKPPPDEETFYTEVPEGEDFSRECHFELDGETFYNWKRWRHYKPHAIAAILALSVEQSERTGA